MRGKKDETRKRIFLDVGGLRSCCRGASEDHRPSVASGTVFDDTRRAGVWFLPTVEPQKSLLAYTSAPQEGEEGTQVWLAAHPRGRGLEWTEVMPVSCQCV